jgi:hypothetical protein
VRFTFRELPGIGPRPIIDVVVDGFDIAPQACLLDSGASAIRFGGDVADICGIDLAGAPRMNLPVGGALVSARTAEVGLRIGDEKESYEWTATAAFCEPWTPAFGLLGLTGFFDRFIVTISAYDELIELRPVS